MLGRTALPYDVRSTGLQLATYAGQLCGLGLPSAFLMVPHRGPGGHRSSPVLQGKRSAQKSMSSESMTSALRGAGKLRPLAKSSPCLWQDRLTRPVA